MKSENPHPQRAVRLAFLRTMRVLRHSVMAGRPITLPNCVRFCKRRLAALGVSDPGVLERITRMYRKHQPFRRGPDFIRTERKKT